ncbi:TetR/AcrR family transcriptional regulator [Nocardiopsis sp. NRRL B-16309]|uniref:TetR/AcrR family transcriptional regulator n=1 Tax=Nocardiopsis sp. NRRL B-16309 TaxID=1519494 RepID=UPI0006AEFDC8|nr:TetR/AcrR family transcriptional regulator [Nocardiopsis sp. NRRL B-16309]KOX14000.1 TetR family transcriptional regulator [Nocardiopsis sp. NRRL B-16309]
MGTKGTATRARLIDGARELLEAHGYAGTGLNQVLAASGAPRGSLYFHFPGGKDELVTAALEAAGAEVGAALADLAAEAPDPVAFVQRMIDLFATRMVESDFTKGCPIAATAVDAAATNDRVHEVCSRVYASWQRELALRLTAEGRAPEAADALAWSALSLVEGAILLARAARSRTPLDRARASVALLLKDA